MRRLPNQQELYEAVVQLVEPFHGCNVLLSPIPDGGFRLADVWERALEGRVTWQRLVVKKSSEYIDDKGTVYTATERRDVPAYRRMLTDPCEALGLAGKGFDYVVILDDTSVTGSTAIGCYLWGLDVKEVLPRTAKGKRPPVVLYLDRDALGMSHLTRVKDFERDGRTQTGPDKFLEKHLPNTYWKYKQRGLVPQAMGLREALRAPVPATRLYPLRVNGDTAGIDEFVQQGQEDVFEALPQKPRPRIVDVLRKLRGRIS